MIGNLCGGFFGDAAHKCSPWHGRIFIANASISCSLPVLYLLFAAPVFARDGSAPMPPLDPTRTAVLGFLLHLSITWTVAGTNRPLLSDVAPPTLRASTMGLDWALETAFGSIVGPSLAAGLAGLFGYVSTTKQVEEMGEMERSANARALGLAIWGITSMCYLTCDIFYGAMHWVYKSDMLRLRGAQAGAQAGGAEGGAEPAEEETKALLLTEKASD